MNESLREKVKQFENTEKEMNEVNCKFKLVDLTCEIIQPFIVFHDEDDAKDKRGNTDLDALKDVQSFALLYGCSPSTGVPAETLMMINISDALIKGLGQDMTCLFPDCMESLKGSDVNFELVTSSSLRSLRLLYDYNFATEFQAVIFVHTELKGSRKKRITRKGLSAMEAAKQAKRDLVATKIFTEENVTICVDLNKKQLVEKFIELRAQADQITAENGPSLAYFIVNIGYMLSGEDHEDILKYLEFPLADNDFLPLTYLGEPFCMHKLCTHLTSTKKVTCALVLENDYHMSS